MKESDGIIIGNNNSKQNNLRKTDFISMKNVN